MGILAVIGNTGAIQQRVGTDWTYNTGQSTQRVFKGVYAAVETLFNSYKAVAGFTPSIDSLQLNYERGLGTLTVSLVEDGPVQYELTSNQVTYPIETHPYFATTSPLTSAEVHAVQTAIKLGINQNPYQTVNGTPLAAPFDGSAFTAKQQKLYDFFSRGVEYYYSSAYVLRSTQIVSKRSTVTASFTGVNTVVTPPDTQAVNTLIGALPSGEWLKQSPNVRMYGNQKWQIVQEWWWAPKWSTILYSGTGSP